MKKGILLITSILLMANLKAQLNYETYYIEPVLTSQDTSMLMSPSTIYKSANGAKMRANGTFRCLTIFVNIIYDQTPSADPSINNSNTYWQPDVVSSINNYAPSYLLNLFDTDIQNNYSGTITRLFAESSFNKLIILSDYMIINIKQSLISPTSSGASFSYSILANKVIEFINNNGGLNTIYNHNSIYDFDHTISGSWGIEKPLTPDSKIDMINILVRNSTRNYGGIVSGQGYSNVIPSNKILIGDTLFGYNIGTFQCIGTGNIANSKSILEHEMTHYFLGGNEFHTSGGNHVGDSHTNTFIGIQMGGYGSLFGGGLRSCNGYERWRLGWHPVNNNYPIECYGQNSEINTQFSGERIFYLRDFVTTGDAIRIKLPYKDTESSSEQYIWIENHQCGKNNKLDNYNFINESCRNFNQPGIFCYYQVGKDILENTNRSLVFPKDEKDNLRQISAEGNYTVSQIGMYNDCLLWAGPNGRPRFEYLSENPFMGINDLTEVYKGDLSYPQLQHLYNYMGSKLKNDTIYDNFPWCVDDLDPFVPTFNGIVLDISSNPSAVNTTTFHSVQYRCSNCSSVSFYASNSQKDTKKIYLTGLNIKMIDTVPNSSSMKSYMVKIRWDDYDVKQNVHWSGDIVLKEQLNLLQNKKITLEQNKTPCQIEKDLVSGYFAPTTFFTCEAGAIVNMLNGSSIQLKDKSSFILLENSTLSMQNMSHLIIEEGATLQIKAGGNLILSGNSKIVIKSGGYICIESGANINLQDYVSLIVLEEGAILGSNLELFANPACNSSITKTGNGTVIDYSQDIYIQNEIISTNRYIGGKNIFVGNHVTNSKPYGNVFINNGADVLFDCKEITFETGFECVNGSSYEVKNH